MPTNEQSGTGPPVPESIGPYRIVGTLGAGGMGVVYVAKHESTHRQVALKTIRVLDADLLRSIRREIQALARLRHPGVVRIVAEGMHEGLPWYAMELLSGTTLRSWRRRLCGEGGGDAGSAGTVDAAATTGWWTTALPVPESRAPRGGDPERRDTDGPSTSAARALRPEHLIPALNVIHRLCAPLAFLHGEGIVHRDLKPDNVLVTADDEPVVVDFGVASQFAGTMGRESLDAAPGGAVGTLRYMAPEQIRAEFVDARADLYALGCILYELLTGRPPFVGSLNEVALRHLGAKPDPPSRLNDAVPAELDELTLRLLEKEPRARPGFAQDIAMALGRMGAGNGSSPSGWEPRAYLYRPGFAGREGILEEFRGELSRLVGGVRGGLALLGGESGVGKTRLLMEVVRAATARNIPILIGECLQTGSSPLQAFRNPLQTIGDQCRTRGRTETDRVLGPRGRLLEIYEPSLTSLPGLENHPEPQPLSPKDARSRLYRGVGQTLQAFAGDGPLLLVLDDLQWSDELTEGALTSLLNDGWLQEAAILVVGAYRNDEASEPVDRLRSLSGATRRELDRLDERSLGRLVGDMLALTEPPEAFCRYLARHSEGNPFFVTEYLRLAVERRILRRDAAGFWKLPQDEAGDVPSRYETLPIPGSLREVVSLRFRDLPEQADALLGAAAVLGRESETSVLSHMVPLEETAFMRAVEQLLRRHVLEERSPGRLRFLHDKLREVAYENLEGGRRRQLHRAAAKGIRALCSDEPGRTVSEQAAVLAYHCLRSEEREASLRYSRIAGQHAMRTSALSEAVSHFESALGLLRDDPDSDETLRLRVDLCLDLYVPLTHLHTVVDERVLNICREAETHARKLDAPERLAAVYSALSAHYYARAEFKAAMDYSQRCRDLSEELGDIPSLVRSQFVLSVCWNQTARVKSHVESNTEIIALMEAESIQAEGFDQMYPPYITLAGTLAFTLATMGRFDEGGTMVQKALDVAESVDDKYALGIAHLWVAFFQALSGDLVPAASSGATCVRLGDEGPFPSVKMMGRYALGLARVLAGRADDAIDCAGEALRLSEGLGYQAMRTDGYWVLGEAYLDKGETRRSREMCQAGLRHVRRYGEWKLESELNRILGEVAYGEGDRRAAEPLLRESLRQSESRSQYLFSARTRLALGRLLLDAGDPETAAKELDEAIPIFRRMKSDRWLRRAEDLRIQC